MSEKVHKKYNVEQTQLKDDLMIDQLRVQQILINLIQNAIKFSEKESVVIVTIVTNLESKTEVNA